MREVEAPNQPLYLLEKLSGSQEVPVNTCVDMVHQANDSPYSTTNTQPLITHALSICDALRRVCPCDDYRDAKKTIVFVTWFTRQTNLAGNSGEKRRI